MAARSPVRILLAEDFPAYRRFVCVLLQSRPEWRVIYEASDGPEVVQKAEELRPDLILLDIGLPKLDGMDVARQLSALGSRSKILFLSEEAALEVVRDALGTGAHGYVLKSQAQTDLLMAVEEVIQGRQFVSSDLRAGLRLQEIRVRLADSHALWIAILVLLLTASLPAAATPTRLSPAPGAQPALDSLSVAEDAQFSPVQGGRSSIPGNRVELPTAEEVVVEDIPFKGEKPSSFRRCLRGVARIRAGLGFLAKPFRGDRHWSMSSGAPEKRAGEK